MLLLGITVIVFLENWSLLEMQLSTHTDVSSLFHKIDTFVLFSLSLKAPHTESAYGPATCLALISTVPEQQKFLLHFCFQTLSNALASLGIK